MRVVSQDGTFCVPIDMYAVSIGNRRDEEKYYVFVNPACFDRHGIKIATYSTQEKAMKALELMRMAYCGVVVAEPIKKSFSKEERQRFLEEVKNTPLQVLNERYSSIECKIWRFPKDNEVIIENENSNT